MKDARATSVAVAVVSRGVSGGGGTDKKWRAAAAATGRNDIILSFKKINKSFLRNTSPMMIAH